jgi:hypothetical protein
MTKVVPPHPCVITVVPSLVKLVIVGGVNAAPEVKVNVAVLHPVT